MPFIQKLKTYCIVKHFLPAADNGVARPFSADVDRDTIQSLFPLARRVLYAAFSSLIKINNERNFEIYFDLTKEKTQIYLKSSNFVFKFITFFF